MGRPKDESEKNNIPKFIRVRFYEIYNSEKTEIDVVIFNISAGKSHILALDSNSCVWGWGSNLKKQIDPNDNLSNSIDYPRKILTIVFSFFTKIKNKFKNIIEFMIEISNN